MTARFSTPEDVNLWDLEMFREGRAHEAFDFLREHAPVHYHDRDGATPFWAITRYDDVKAVLRDPMTFSSAKGMALQPAVEPDDPMAGFDIGEIAGGQMLIMTDPPRHRGHRKVLVDRFTPLAIRALEPRVREITNKCLDEAAEAGEVDFVNDIAHRVPSSVTFDIMGVPEEDWARLAELEHQLITPDDADTPDGLSPVAAALGAQAEILAYFGPFAMERRANPGDDIISALTLGTVEGAPLSDMEVVLDALLFIAGGLDTTRASASSGGLLGLLDNPDQEAALRKDPTMINTAVEEFVRWASPIVHVMRTATCDTEVRGQTIKEGDTLGLWLASANRDSAVFDNPYTFDIARQKNEHVSFSYGEHFCLGAHLARLVLRVEFEEMLARFTKIELIDEPQRVKSNFVGGLKHAKVRLTNK